MSKVKPTITDAVVDLLSRNHAIYQCLRMELLNYHALASMIKPSVDSLVRRDVGINTIVVAIKRFSDAQSKLRLPRAMSILRDARITLTSGLAEATITPERGNFIKALKRLVELSSELTEPPHIFPLATSIKVIADTRDIRNLKTKLGGEYSLKSGAKVAKLTLHLTEAAEKTPGVAAYVTDLLYRNGINILSAILGYEIILILDEADGPLAFTVLKSELAKTQKPVPAS